VEARAHAHSIFATRVSAEAGTRRRTRNSASDWLASRLHNSRVGSQSADFPLRVRYIPSGEMSSSRFDDREKTESSGERLALVIRPDVSRISQLLLESYLNDAISERAARDSRSRDRLRLIVGNIAERAPRHSRVRDTATERPEGIFPAGTTSRTTLSRGIDGLVARSMIHHLRIGRL